MNYIVLSLSLMITLLAKADAPKNLFGKNPLAYTGPTISPDVTRYPKICEELKDNGRRGHTNEDRSSPY